MRRVFARWYRVYRYHSQILDRPSHKRIRSYVVLHVSETAGGSGEKKNHALPCGAPVV